MLSYRPPSTFEGTVAVSDCPIDDGMTCGLFHFSKRSLAIRCIPWYQMCQFLEDCTDNINGCMLDSSARRTFNRELSAKVFERVDRVYVSTTFTLQFQRKVSTPDGPLLHCTFSVLRLVLTS